MSRVLIVYGTKEGQTAKIANRIGDIIRERGYEPVITNAKEVKPNIPMKDYSAVLVGTSIHMGSFNTSVSRFISRHKADLDRLPSAFFSVSMADAMTSTQPSHMDSQLKSFYDKTGWHPRTVGRFAGAVAYTKYGFCTRYMLKWGAKGAGYSSDTSRDHEYTNWDQVNKFANDFIETVQESTVSAQAES